jgi:hypothetical protein
MRRTIAIFVLLVMVAAISAPLAWAAQVGDAHACCRRGGAHHCTEKSSTGHQAFQTKAPTCPLQHSTKLLRDRSTSVLTSLTPFYQLSVVAFATSAPISPKAASNYNVSLLTRGPPLS